MAQPRMEACRTLGDDQRFLAAFPEELHDDVVAAVGTMPAATHRHAETFSVRCDGEWLSIPYRIYNAEPDPAPVRRLSSLQRTVLGCLYTRHDDGFVRQRHLEQVIASQSPWVVPYVVKLVGEYVIEIIALIGDRLPELRERGSAQRGRYGRFVGENAAFMEVTASRVASYWNCYYRSRYPRKETYPGFVLLDALMEAGKEQHDAAASE